MISENQRVPIPVHAASEGAGWCAVYTYPQTEFSVVRGLGVREIQSFLPTYEVQRSWKNRRKVNLTRPLFPGYVFVRADARNRPAVLRTPGVIHIVGSRRGASVIPDREIEFLELESRRNSIEPFSELLVGQPVQVRRGAMMGIQGVLVKKSNGSRFVLTIEAIQQHVSVEVDAADLELVQ